VQLPAQPPVQSPRDPRQPPARVGVIGLGPMGQALVTSLLAAGFPVCCHDIRPAAVAPMAAAGATTAPDPAAIARSSDFVVTFLPGPAEVAAVALDPDRGVLAGLPPGGLLMDMSTCGPDTAQLIGAAFEQAGRRFVDCPVSRKAPAMTVLVGGPAGVLGDAGEAVDAVSRAVVYCGFRGAGYATKLLNQHVKYAWYLASAEALVLAGQLGLDPDVTATAIEQSSGGESGFTTAAKYFRGDVAGMRGHAPASTIEKDMDLAESMAAAAGARSRTLDVTADFFTAIGTTKYRELPYPQSCEFLTGLRVTQRHDGQGKDRGHQ
jgi:3-hydroxyisobutyrate dehydrogenase-like beta-hydroxyacid dehydrogenase